MPRALCPDCQTLIDEHGLCACLTVDYHVSPSCPKHTTGGGPCYCGDLTVDPKYTEERTLCTRCYHGFVAAPPVERNGIMFDVCPCCKHHMIREVL